MYTSLFSGEVQNVFDKAEKMAGRTGGPFPSPADWRDQVIYFIMVDRFNNPRAKPVHAPYDDPDYGLYQGGKFAGIREQLGYIKNLGAGAIWLSPVLKNLPWDKASYHGYGIHDLLRANPQFALDANKADEELRELVDAAHQAGLYVIFDIVLNHTGNVFAYTGNPAPPFSASPLPVQWRDKNGNPMAQDTDVAAIPNPSTDAVVWPAELQKNNYFRRQGSPDPQGDDTTGDFASLKQWRTDDPEVQHFLIRAHQYLIARYDVDGFRIDTLRYLKNNLAQLFGNSIREYALTLGKKNFFTFGEVLDATAEEDIAKFIGRNTTTGSGINSPVGVDAALDYPLFNTFVPVAKGAHPPNELVDMYHLRKQAEQYILSSHGDASRYFVTFLDNHDMKKRFLWVEPGNEHYYDDQLTMALTCLYCLPGIPCVYYGTEQGLHGINVNGNANDAVVREALWGIQPQFPQNAFFYTEMKKIAQLRTQEPTLRYGRFYFRPVSGNSFNFSVSPYPGGILAWSRILNDREVLIVANTNPHPIPPIAVDVILDSTLSRSGQPVSVLYSNKHNPVAPSAVKTLAPVQVIEIDGSTGTGPVHITRVTLASMEVQILRATL